MLRAMSRYSFTTCRYLWLDHFRHKNTHFTLHYYYYCSTIIAPTVSSTFIFCTQTISDLAGSRWASESQTPTVGVYDSHYYNGTAAEEGSFRHLPCLTFLG